MIRKAIGELHVDGLGCTLRMGRNGTRAQASQGAATQIEACLPMQCGVHEASHHITNSGAGRRSRYSKSRGNCSKLQSGICRKLVWKNWESG